MLIEHPIDVEIIESLDYDVRWNGPDKGLLLSYQIGRQKAITDPELAARAKAGELPLLPYKGGVERTLKTSKKIGSLHYLAAWQGLRGENLHIQTDLDVVLVCKRTGTSVTFTGDLQRLKMTNTEEE